MWLLGRILPSVIGEHVPDDDERWVLFLCLMDIVDLLFAPTTSKDHCVYLSSLIKDHHCEFVQLYPDASVIPKFHFMVHTGRLMIKLAVSCNNASNVFTHLQIWATCPSLDNEIWGEAFVLQAIGSINGQLCKCSIQSGDEASTVSVLLELEHKCPSWICWWPELGNWSRYVA